MKKIIFIICFMALMAPGMAQYTAIISGVVTDSATGNPIAGKDVSILTDSSSGFFYSNVVPTNTSGYYVDSIWLPFMWHQTFTVSVLDCHGILHHDTCSATMSNPSKVINFSICQSDTSSCDAEFTYNADSLTPQTIYFTDQSSGNIAQWSWDFGDGTPPVVITYPSNPDVIHTYAGANLSYIVCLTVHGNDTTCDDVQCSPVYIGGGNGCNAGFTFAPDSTVFPTAIQFTDTSSGNIALWSWDFGDGNTTVINYPNNPDVVHTYAVANLTYNVCLTVQGNDSSCYDIQCSPVYVGGGTGCDADFTFTPDSAVYLTTIQFTDVSSGNIIGWSWNFDDPASGTNNFSSLQNPAHAFSAPGTYNVCLTVQGSDSSCYDIQCSLVYVKGDSGCEASFTFTPDSAVYLTAVQFTDLSSGNITSWSWNFDDPASGINNVSSGQNPIHVFSAPGIYDVCLTIQCDSTLSTWCTPVTVLDSSSFYNVYGQVFAGNFPLVSGLALICSLDTTGGFNPYIDMSIIDTNGVYYFTMVPDGNYYILAIPLDSNNYLPTYYGDVINWEDAILIQLGNPSNPYNIHLVQAGELSAGPGSISGQIASGSLRTGMTDKIVMFLNDGTGSTVSFNQVSSSGSFGFPSLQYGEYYLYPELAGCTGDLIMIELTAQNPTATVNLTFTGNSILGTEEKDPPTITGISNLYPNPADMEAFLDVTVNKTTGLRLGLYNLSGRCVKEIFFKVTPGTNRLTIPVNQLFPGLYTLRIISDQGLSESRKLMISK